MNSSSDVWRKSVTFLVALLLVLAWSIPGAQAQQVKLDPKTIPQFVDPLPQLTTIVDDGSEITLDMIETTSPVLSTGTLGAGVTQTTIWKYDVTGGPSPLVTSSSYISPVIVATRGQATQIRYKNSLPDTNTQQIIFWKNAVDMTLHWADPVYANPADRPDRLGLFVGDVPAVPHLHGGEVPAQLDGGPDSWFTNDTVKGHAFYTRPGVGVANNEAVYSYPNMQEPANIWFHDHGLGITRLNVYAGMAGAYIITADTNPPPADLNDPTKIIPLVIQDRDFDINGQLFFDNLGINPTIHPYWVPEFFSPKGAICVNGKTWPYLEVQNNLTTTITTGRYRCLFLNGSNSRAYEMSFDKVKGKVQPKMYVIGTDGGYLQNPVLLNGPLTIMPGERYDVIIDFNGIPAGTNMLLRNTARTPFPDGVNANPATTGKIMEFRLVNAIQQGWTPTEVTFDPATFAGNIRAPLETLTQGPKTRLLTLNEVMAAGGPQAVLVNNTLWSGESVSTGGTPTTRGDFKEVVSGGIDHTYYSELPQEGDTELWEIVNITADAHPIHLHLVQFQLQNRQAFKVNQYLRAYDAAFPTGVFIPFYGPPYNYGEYQAATYPPHPLAAGKLGGNPDVFPYLSGAPVGPLPQEAGWKDTMIMYPGQVTRIMVRWAPTDATTTGQNYFPFDPSAEHGYVWHCHIIDHEDNEMMRPDQVQANLPGGASRSYVQGTDY